MPLNIIKVYTDGSCHTQLKCGAWAAVIINNSSEYIIKGTATNTTHNRMELQAIINAVEYVTLCAISFDKNRNIYRQPIRGKLNNQKTKDCSQ